MTTVATTRDRKGVTATINEWLVPEARELTPKVGNVVAREPHLQARGAENRSKLNKAARLTLAALIVHELRKALPDDLVELMVTGMKGHSALVEAARTTAGDPAADGHVHLFRHTIHLHHSVDVEAVAPAFRIKLPFELNIDIDVVAADATVADGRLRSLSLPDPTLTGTVTVHSEKVYEQKGVLLLGRTLGFDPPRAILPEQEELDLRAGRAT
jgi:hypothetical protein